MAVNTTIGFNIKLVAGATTDPQTQSTTTAQRNMQACGSLRREPYHSHVPCWCTRLHTRRIAPARLTCCHN